MKKQSPPVSKYNAWNPGLNSSLPPRLLPFVTLFLPENSHVGYPEAKEASDFCGLPVEQLCVLRIERLVIHEVLVRVTSDLSVPDDPSYEYLGIQIRGMADQIFQNHMIPEMPEIAERYEKICKKAELLIRELFDSALKEELLDHGRKASKKRNIFNIFKSKNRAPEPPSGSREEIVLSQLREQKYFSDDFSSACISALVMIISGIMGKQGRLVTDQNLITNLSLRLFMNDYGSREVGKIITSRFVKAAKAEGYRFLPAQSNPIVMNTKGASASGKSTIRPKQRILAEKLGVAWEDFALISPDYWRKYLLDYQSMGEDYKYAAMLTGRELEFIDKKLDDYMAQKAADKNVPHLLIDRFRFDSFKTDEQNGQKNTLLSRFGSTIYLFFTITPPQETVERAWKRGLSTSRYKAVDDLLYHNIEAFKGIPQLFFSWMEIKEKDIHFEFLDNDVPLGESPKTVAFGRNGVMTVLDPIALSNIDRFKEVNTSARNACEVLDQNWRPNYNFLKQCIEMVSRVEFVNNQSFEIYGRTEMGHWDYTNSRTVGSSPELHLILSELGWKKSNKQKQTKIERIDVKSQKIETLGAW